MSVVRLSVRRVGPVERQDQRAGDPTRVHVRARGVRPRSDRSDRRVGVQVDRLPGHIVVREPLQHETTGENRPILSRIFRRHVTVRTVGQSQSTGFFF